MQFPNLEYGSCLHPKLLMLDYLSHNASMGILLEYNRSFYLLLRLPWGIPGFRAFAPG